MMWHHHFERLILVATLFSSSTLASFAKAMPERTRPAPKKLHLYPNTSPEPTRMLWELDEDPATISAFHPGLFHRSMRPEVWCTGTALTGSACVELARRWDCGLGSHADNMAYVVCAEEPKP